MLRTTLILLATAAASTFAADMVLIRKVDGSWIEGKTETRNIEFGSRRIPLSQLLSFHAATAPSAAEKSRIQSGLAAIQGADRAARDLAVEELSAIGIPVLTPLLDSYKDTDQHEPRPLYRLFERVIPSAADGFDRSQSLVRLRGGEMLRIAAGTPAGSVTVDGKQIP